MWIGKWTIVIVLFMASMSFALPQVSGQNELGAAVAAERDKDYSEAARHYLKFLSISPNPASAAQIVDIRVRLAIDQFLAHQYRASLQALAPLLEEHAYGSGRQIHAQAWIVAGLDELQLNHLDRAIRDLCKGLHADPASGTARLALGDALARSGHLYQAVRQYREQTKRTPKVVEAWYKLGMAESLLARIVRKRFEQTDPANPVSRLLKARDLLESGNSLGAADILLPLAGPGVPVSAPAGFLPGLHALLGQALLDQKYTQAARHEFMKEIANDPASAPAWFGLAEVDTLESRWERIRSRVHQLLLDNPHYLANRLRGRPAAPLREAWDAGRLHMPQTVAGTQEGGLWLSWIKTNGIARVHIESKQRNSCSRLPARQVSTAGMWLTEGCAGRLARKLESKPSLSPEESVKLAEVEYRLGRFQKAEGAARRAAKDGTPSSLTSAWGTYWMIRSDEELSMAAIERAASVNPDAPRVRQMLAQNYADHYQWSRAIKEYQAALRLAPNLAGLHFGLGTACWQAGRWREAEQQLEQTLQITPESAVAAYELGDTDINLRRWAKAVPNLKKALANPAVARKARMDLAKAESELGHDHEALQNLILLENNDPDGQVHFRLGMLYRKLGQKEKARRALAESQKLHQARDAMTTERMMKLEQERAHLEKAQKEVGQ